MSIQKSRDKLHNSLYGGLTYHENPICDPAQYFAFQKNIYIYIRIFNLISLI